MLSFGITDERWYIYVSGAEFSLSESRYIVTEGVNSTITICVVMNVGYLEKSVLLTLDNGGSPFYNCACTYYAIDVLFVL